jgi:multidrug resistance efflux pump
MITVITAIYCAIVYAAFRIIKIPLRTTNITAAIVIGIFLIGSIVVGWQGAAPVSQQITLTRYIVALNTDLKALIKTINVKPGQHVKKGDVLFELDRGQFEGPVAQFGAQVEAAKKEVDRLQAALELSEASISSAKAQRESVKAKRDAERKLKALGSAAVRELTLFQLERAYDAANASVVQAEASKREAVAALASGRAKVASVQGQLDKAEADLSRTTYKAPADGRILNWQARVGTITTSLRASAIGTFMEAGNARIIVVLPQNLLRNVAVGDPVELAFLGRPGHIDSGKVIRIANYTGEGQISPQGNLPVAANVASKGFFALAVTLDDDTLSKSLGLGEAGAAAIYTKPSGPFHIISKIYLRAVSLSFYLPR